MAGSLKLDRLDLRILSQLQKNGRITNVDLADAVGLSPSPCLIRVKRLEQAGYIAGYGAQLRLEKLGDTLTVFQVSNALGYGDMISNRVVDALGDLAGGVRVAEQEG